MASKKAHQEILKLLESRKNLKLGNKFKTKTFKLTVLGAL